MSIRSVASASISFGLVSIPVKLYTAASPNGVSFNMITSAGNRVRRKFVDAVDGTEVEENTCHRGFEVAKEQFVVFSPEELKALEAEKSPAMEIQEFVKAGSVDLVQVEKSYYIGPDKGGDKGYLLLSETMAAIGMVAVAQWCTRGKEHLVVIRPYRTGLVLHQMYYADEVRDFNDIPVAKVTVSDAEREMAAKLIQSLSFPDDRSNFDPSKYEDGHTKRVMEAVERKQKGLAPLVTPQAPKQSLGNMLDALKASIAAVKKDKK